MPKKNSSKDFMSSLCSQIEEDKKFQLNLAFVGLLNLFAVAIVLFYLFTSIGCAHKVPDVPVCTEITMDRGNCIHIISGRNYEINDRFGYKIEIDGKERVLTWWELRPLMIQIPYPAWVELKSFIIKICKDKNTCQKHVTSWERSVKIIDDELATRLPSKLP